MNAHLNVSPCGVNEFKVHYVDSSLRGRKIKRVRAREKREGRVSPSRALVPSFPFIFPDPF